MKKKLNKNLLLIAADILLIPGLVLCKWLSGRMLAQTTQCEWLRYGGKCVTCGGTHFVNTLLSGQFAEAFEHNQFLFLLTVALAICFVLLNLAWLFDVKFAKTALSKIFTIPVLIITLSVMLLFFFARNMPVFIRMAQYLSQKGAS